MADLIEAKPNDPRIVTERRNEVRVGRLVIPTVNLIRWESAPTYLRYFNALNTTHPGNTEGEYLRRRLVFSLNNNTSNNNDVLAHERPVSAYFTYSPREEVVIIEWGTIDPQKGEAKLHTFLNEVIDYPDRVRQGMKLSSGHIARITDTPDEVYLALLDNLPSADTKIAKDDPMGKLINALHFAGFVPVNGAGYVRLPAF